MRNSVDKKQTVNVRVRRMRYVIAIFTLLPMAVAATINLRMQTDLGAIDIELFDTVTPRTVTNFLNYVNDGDYDVLKQRHLTGFANSFYEMHPQGKPCYKIFRLDVPSKQSSPEPNSLTAAGMGAGDVEHLPPVGEGSHLDLIMVSWFHQFCLLFAWSGRACTRHSNYRMSAGQVITARRVRPAYCYGTGYCTSFIVPANNRVPYRNSA